MAASLAHRSQRTRKSGRTGSSYPISPIRYLRPNAPIIMMQAFKGRNWAGEHFLGSVQAGNQSRIHFARPESSLRTNEDAPQRYQFLCTSNLVKLDMSKLCLGWKLKDCDKVYTEQTFAIYYNESVKNFSFWNDEEGRYEKENKEQTENTNKNI